MQWGVLGPLAVCTADGSVVSPAGRVRRLLLAALLSRPNQTVTADVLADEVWAGAPPRTAAKTLQSHVVRLRDDLGRDGLGGALLTAPTGYRLVVADDELDAAVFTALTGSATDRRRRGDPAGADADLRRALSLWRGAAYEEFVDAPFLVSERLRLGELRAYAEEQQVDVALELGRAAELVPVLEQRLLATPYRERTWEQLALALYRAGRQADALASCRRAREVLAADLGVDPGPGLRDLEQRVLRHDPELVGAGAGLVDLGLTEEAVAAGCPYRGLDGYRDDDTAVFVGRERLTARLATACATHDVVVVTGASGAGKSSLVRAGLVPALRRGAVPDSAAWRTRVTTPTRLTAADTATDLLVLDQAEELFTALDAERSREAVRELLARVDDGMRLVLVLRSDCYSRLVDLPPLDAYAQTATVLVGPLRDDELRRVVIEPAHRAGVTVEGDAVEAVLEDAAGRPDALPMVSVALVRAWSHHDGPVLTRDDYVAGGGVAEALEAAAEEVYERLDPQAQQAARRLLVRLAVADSGRWSRRALPRPATSDEAEERAVGALVEGRLLVADQGRLELVHDALLDRWPRLRTWLADRALDAELLAHLTGAAHRWAAGGRLDADLYRGARLQAVQDWQEQHGDDLSAEEEEFLVGSAQAAEAELLRERARADREAAGRRRLRRALTALAAVTVVTLLVGAVAVAERTSADREAHRAHGAALTADARRLAALALTAPDLRTSLLLAVQAYRLQDSPDTRSALLTALQHSGSALFHVPTHERVLWLGADRSGASLWWMDNTREVTRFDVRTRRVVAQFPARADSVAALSPEATQLVTLGRNGYDDTAGATRATVVDALSGRQLHVLPTRAASQLTAAYTADGRWLVVPVAAAPDGTAGSAVDVYAAAGVLARPARRLHVPATITGLAAGRNRIALVDAAGTVTLLDPASGRTVATRTDRELAGSAAVPAALSADDRHVAVAPSQHPTTVTVLDVAGPTSSTTGDTGGAVSSLAFAPGGGPLAAGTEAGGVIVYGVDGAVAERTAGESAPVRGIAWSGSGGATGLFTAGLDEQVVSWDVRQRDRLLALGAAVDPGLSLGIATSRSVVTLSPPLFSVPSHEEQLATLDDTTGAVVRWPLGLRDDEQVAELSPDAQRRRVVVTVLLPNRSVRCDVWDVASRTRVASVVPTRTSSRHQAYGAALSPDGSTMVANLSDRRLGVFAVPSGHLLRTLDVRFSGPTGGRTLATPFAFAPDGRLLVWGFDPGPVLSGAGSDPVSTERARAVQQLALLDVSGRVEERTASLAPLALVDAVSWSPDGRRLVVGAADGNMWLLDAPTLRELRGPVTVTSDAVDSVGFAGPDTVVTTGDNGTLALWAAATLTPIGQAFHAGPGAWPGPVLHRGELSGVAPTADGGQRRFTLSLRPSEWARLACAVAGPPLSRSEWSTYVGDLPYRSRC